MKKLIEPSGMEESLHQQLQQQLNDLKQQHQLLTDKYYRLKGSNQQLIDITLNLYYQYLPQISTRITPLPSIVPLDEDHINETIGHYKVISTRTLGQGSTALVIEVEQQNDPAFTHYAIKILDKRKALSPQGAISIYDEIQALSQISHPNIVHLHEVMQSQYYIYIVLEKFGQNYVQFEHHNLEQFKLLSPQPPYWIDLVQQLLSAIAYLHHNNIGHRDIKPENCLIEQTTNHKLVLKLCDFGFCVLGCTSLQYVSSGLYGTIGYIAPEIVLCQEAYNVKQTDIWSVGATILYILNGRDWFKTHWMEAYSMMYEKDPTLFRNAIQLQLANLHHHLPEDDNLHEIHINEILTNCLQYNALQRYLYTNLKLFQTQSSNPCDPHLHNSETSHCVTEHLPEEIETEQEKQEQQAGYPSFQSCSSYCSSSNLNSNLNMATDQLHNTPERIRGRSHSQLFHTPTRERKNKQRANSSTFLAPHLDARTRSGSFSNNNRTRSCSFSNPLQPPLQLIDFTSKITTTAVVNT